MATLFERATRLITEPGSTWTIIRDEPADRQALLMGYVVPLAAIPPIASVLGHLLMVMPGMRHTGFGAVFTGAFVSFILSIAGVFVFAFILNALATTFGARRNFDRAFKVAAYTPTATWLAGIFNLIPILSIFSLLGLYSLYLLFVGNPKLMEPAPEKATAYTVTALVAALIFAFIIGTIQTAIMFGPGGPMMPR
ncbi:Yip1 family protein [Henriciella aquimarina]|uniref:Yip1 family protein n=1 Tax=Henriciella aquimarina TaxID=545261 RepID=UPI001301F787|nr:Yip1 family protein [Henriciella aquimarina]